MDELKFTFEFLRSKMLCYEQRMLPYKIKLPN